ncbi:MAG: hypothetical protein HFI39_10690 [Lachnospiraceae bacterium]|nr:hypothetical protein [Lachnospiraceae bacterium]
MSIFSRHFPLGLGTSRFPISGPDDTQGIEKSVKLVRQALESGITYVDVGYNYSAGMAPFVLKEAFRQTNRPFSVTAKVMYGQDRTADEARRRIELYLKTMGLEKAQYFTCWTIWNYGVFENIMKKGGIYEGALRMKEEGLIDHICCSLHAVPGDILKIIESGAFEGITISYSMLSAANMLPVLDAAYAKGVGVAVMNPLGGGVIAQNKDYFSFACGDQDEGNTIHAALRFVKAHPAVDIVLGGVKSEEELKDSLGVFSKPDPEPPAKRLERVMGSVAGLKGFCTGCKYCAGCPQGIPTAAIMQARNALLFEPVASYNRTEPEELLYHIQMFRPLLHDEGWIPKSAQNPCLACGKCERQCTQKLGIIDAVADIYRRAQRAYFTKEAHKERLQELLVEKGYTKVGLYPNGGFSNLIIRLYEEFFGEPEFEWLQFNSDPKMWGQTADGRVVHGPEEIRQLRPDLILICTYKYDQDILESLRPYEEEGVKLVKLHRAEEMPWVF